MERLFQEKHVMTRDREGAQILARKSQPTSLVLKAISINPVSVCANKDTLSRIKPQESSNSVFLTSLFNLLQLKLLQWKQLALEPQESLQPLTLSKQPPPLSKVQANLEPLLSFLEMPIN